MLFGSFLENFHCYGSIPYLTCIWGQFMGEFCERLIIVNVSVCDHNYCDVPNTAQANTVHPCMLTWK